MAYSSSQSITVVVLIASIIFYFAATSALKQNAFLYVFAIALTILIVGNSYFNVDVLFMNPRGFEYEPHYENWQKRRDEEMEA